MTLYFPMSTFQSPSKMSTTRATQPPPARPSRFSWARKESIVFNWHKLALLNRWKKAHSDDELAVVINAVAHSKQHQDTAKILVDLDLDIVNEAAVSLTKNPVPSTPVHIRAKVEAPTVDWQKLIDAKDHYELFGVKRNASVDEIRKAYKSLALATHPDKHSASEQGCANLAFQLLTTAYTTLSDPSLRKKYDASLIPPPAVATIPSKPTFDTPPLVPRKVWKNSFIPEKRSLSSSNHGVNASEYPRKKVSPAPTPAIKKGNPFIPGSGGGKKEDRKPKGKGVTPIGLARAY
ncbi:DnaJ-domain-containing protein [Atractiella rhizophila]|nr:DnaJ-domain-containing protein [Atractiella rhizophila]